MTENWKLKKKNLKIKNLSYQRGCLSMTKIEIVNWKNDWKIDKSFLSAGLSHNSPWRWDSVHLTRDAGVEITEISTFAQSWNFIGYRQRKMYWKIFLCRFWWISRKALTHAEVDDHRDINICSAAALIIVKKCWFWDKYFSPPEGMAFIFACKWSDFINLICWQQCLTWSLF